MGHLSVIYNKYFNWHILVLPLLAVQLLQASPTENEFEICKKKAVSLLEHCLEDSNHYNNLNCWKKSRSGFSLCSNSIKSEHVRDNKRIEKLKDIEESSDKNVSSSSTDKIQYSRIIDSLGKGRTRKTIKLLEQFHEKSGPVFRSYFLLAMLYQKINNHEKALEFLDIVPSEETTAEYWYAQMISYDKTIKSNASESVEKLHLSMERVINTVSFFPEGLDDKLFNILKRFPSKIIHLKLCSKRQLIDDERCN